MKRPISSIRSPAYKQPKAHDSGKSRGPMQKVKMLELRGVHHIALICTDYETSKRFYSDVLGFSLKSEVFRADRQSWMGDFALNGTYVLELFSFPNPPLRPSGPEAIGLRHLAFEVDDVESSLKELRRAGVRCEELRIDPYTGKQMAFFFDPDGQPLEIYQH